MDFVGNKLKNTRLKQGISIQKVCKELNINLSIIQDIEEDAFPDYLDKVYLIGHLKSYAKYLQLNHEDIIADFKIQTSYNNLKENKEIQKPINKITFLSFSKSISFVIFFFIATGFYFLFYKPLNTENYFAMTPEVPENFQHDLEETEMNLILSNKSEEEKNNLKEELEIKKNFSDIQDNKLLNNNSAIASISNDAEKEYIKNYVTLKFLNPTWIQLRDNEDKIVFSRLMQKKEEYSYSILEKFNLTAGNAGNIIVSIDGVTKGKLGKVGDVVDSLIIDNNFRN